MVVGGAQHLECVECYCQARRGLILIARPPASRANSTAHSNADNQVLRRHRGHT